MKRVAEPSEPAVLIPPVLRIDVVGVDDPLVGVFVEDERMPVVVAVLPKSMCKISSVPPSFEYALKIASNVGSKSTNILHQVSSVFWK